MKKRNKKTAVFLILFLCFLMTGLAFFIQTRWYSQFMFQRFSRICYLLIEEEPEIKPVLLSVLKQYQKELDKKKLDKKEFDKKEFKQTEMEMQTDQQENFLLQHGYAPRNFPAEPPAYFWIVPAAFFLIGSVCFFFLFFFLEKRNQKRVGELTSYLEKVNLNGTGTIIQKTEDEFSLLQDEIYKTVTELYQTREAALHAKEHYADNLANIAHQLKTPISAALLSLQLLKEETMSEYANQVQRQLERLYVLELALLTLSRIDSGTLKLACVPVDIYTTLNLAADNLYDLLAEREITVQIPEPSGDNGNGDNNDNVIILGDMDWTMEAFLNLMKNCMEHSPRGGTIYCNYSANPLYAEIHIWDEGDGFAKKDLPHLFERFYRGENAAGHGLGLGLAIAKDIFALQNGSISARNLPKKGACFEIRIYSH